MVSLFRSYDCLDFRKYDWSLFPELFRNCAYGPLRMHRILLVLVEVTVTFAAVTVVVVVAAAVVVVVADSGSGDGNHFACRFPCQYLESRPV